MAGKQQRSRRTIAGLLVGGIALALVVAPTAAGATGATGATGANQPTPMVAYVGPMVGDGTCPPNPEFDAPDFHQVLLGVTWTQRGPAVLVIDLCYVFSGALGGASSTGTFWLSDRYGRLEGHTAGVIAYGNPDRISQTLTVDRGTGRYSGVTGTIDFKVDINWEPTACGCLGSLMTPALRRGR